MKNYFEASFEILSYLKGFMYTHFFRSVEKKRIQGKAFGALKFQFKKLYNGQGKTETMPPPPSNTIEEYFSPI